MCHVPNLTSSGRGTDLATYPNAPDNAFPPPGGDVDAANPLTYPEEGQSFKTLIHSIHASAKRENPFEFVRVRCSSSFSTACALYYDFSEVTFPGILSDCSTCHVDATRSTDAGYSVLLPEDALPTTIRITSDANGDDASPLAVRSARDSVPNATDRVITPVAAACIGCHDSDIAREHMEGHGARVDVARSDAEKGDYVETCTLCHGPGRTVDVELMHGF
jgi:OmcA/MtrC family decaheme c-type cytochrome